MNSFTSPENTGLFTYYQFIGIVESRMFQTIFIHKIENKRLNI